jgi:hypothetical protein
MRGTFCGSVFDVKIGAEVPLAGPLMRRLSVIVYDRQGSARSKETKIGDSGSFIRAQKVRAASKLMPRVIIFCCELGLEGG